MWECLLGDLGFELCLEKGVLGFFALLVWVPEFTVPDTAAEETNSRETIAEQRSQ